MSIDSRLNAIQKQIDDNAELYQVMPDFDKWTNAELTQYNVKWLNEFVAENRLTSFSDAETLLKKWYDKNLMSEQDFNLIVNAFKEYFEQASLQNDDGPVFFIS